MTHTREESGFRPLKAGAFMDALGPVEGRKGEDGGYCCAMLATEAHANAIGLIHGGVTASLLDQAIAICAWHAADRIPTVTVQMDIRYVSAARPGDRLTAHASLREKSSSMLFLDGEITAEGRLVALATTVMKTLRKDA